MTDAMPARDAKHTVAEVLEGIPEDQLMAEFKVFLQARISQNSKEGHLLIGKSNFEFENASIILVLCFAPFVCISTYMIKVFQFHSVIILYSMYYFFSFFSFFFGGGGGEL